MDKVKKTLIKSRFLPFAINESLLSMILGAVVVVVVGVLAYNYFQSQRGVETPSPETVITTQKPDGFLGEAKNAVALPATHTVEAGENLWVIAEKYYKSGYNFPDIAQANNLASADDISAGQKLKIPVVREVKVPTIADSVAPTVTLSKIEGKSYTVQNGDYLWEIALRAYGDGYKWVDIARANRLVQPDVIHPGNTLNLPR